MLLVVVTRTFLSPSQCATTLDIYIYICCRREATNATSLQSAVSEIFMLSGNNYLGLCSKCVKEDRIVLGLNYWNSRMDQVMYFWTCRMPAPQGYMYDPSMHGIRHASCDLSTNKWARSPDPAAAPSRQRRRPPVREQVQHCAQIHGYRAPTDNQEQSPL
jgi:hypothetical protein